MELDRLIATTHGYLQTLKRMEREHRANLRLWAALEKKRILSASLTAEEEALVGGKSHQSYIDEWARLGYERHEIAQEVRSALLPEVWAPLRELEFDYPNTRGVEQGFRTLLEDLPEDSTETEWVTGLLLRLDTLLRDAAYKAFGKPVFLNALPSDPSAKKLSFEELQIPTRTVKSNTAQQPQKHHRVPDYETSRERIDLLEALVGELTTIHQQRHKFGSVDALRQKYPEFQVWTLLPPSEHRELMDDFKPKAFAQSLVLRKYGLTSRETLKADRRKLRQQSQHS